MKNSDTVFITSWGPLGYAEYAERFVNSFARTFQHILDPDLVVYVEYPQKQFKGPKNCGIKGHSRFPYYKSLTDCSQYQNFIFQYENDAKIRGQVELPGQKWKPHERSASYNFRYDAWKFFRKPVAICDFANTADINDYWHLIWIDADTVFHKKPPPEFIDNLLQGKHYAYLGRKGIHSECGFLAFEMPTCLPLIDAWCSEYIDGSFLDQEEWHDSFLFDAVRSRFPEIQGNDIATEDRGHVWFSSPLAEYCDHLKGPRKAMGFSPERKDWKKPS